jgi:hypothetical protein
LLQRQFISPESGSNARWRGDTFYLHLKWGGYSDQDPTDK